MKISNNQLKSIRLKRQQNQQDSKGNKINKTQKVIKSIRLQRQIDQKAYSNIINSLIIKSLKFIYCCTLMSATILNTSTVLDTSNHSLNTSQSKQKFSFPKTQRFANKTNNNICDSIYDIPSTRNIRTTSFGYGNKNFGIKIDKNKPEPATYTLPSEFDEKKKGVSFGEGREKLQIGGPLRDSLLQKYIPGPGQYNTLRPLDIPTITLKSRIADKSMDHHKKIPGPGAYDFGEVGTTKYYADSRNTYSCGVKIVASKRLQSLNRRVTLSVGPASYSSKNTEMSPEGNYVLSRYENSKSRIFSKLKRPSLINQNQLSTPGPGNYSNFSSFG